MSSRYIEHFAMFTRPRLPASKKHNRECSKGASERFHIPRDLYNCVLKRETCSVTESKIQRICDAYTTYKLPDMLVEKEYDLTKYDMNKIFASQWLNERQVVFGTKCNKVVVWDLITKQFATIPSLKSSDESIPAECPCGIHGIAINPSKTLLATGAQHTNDVGVYRLPSFDPLCIGERAHNDWIFDLVWLDDQFLMTGSRDNHLALWQFMEDEDVVSSDIMTPANTDTVSNMKSLQLPEYGIKTCVESRTTPKADKVRALGYNKQTEVIAALTLNAYLHFWDVSRFECTHSERLLHLKENVCLSSLQERNIYAVGSQSHVTIVDGTYPKNMITINSPQRGSGIRSLAFRGDLLSIGTGEGALYFFDIRANKYLYKFCECCQLSLNMGKGWLRQGQSYMDIPWAQDNKHAIYTHHYDPSGTRLLTAGGPLPAGLYGNYIGIWH